jgi:hypothetical protein
MARYRQLSPQVQAAPPTNTPLPVVAAPVPTLSGEGTWEEEAGGYVVAMTDANGKEVKGTARIRADEMILSVAGANLVFAKQ